MIEEHPQKPVPVIELTRGEFAAIPKVRSQAEVVSLSKRGFKRVAMLGDCGNSFVCYPGDNQVFVVKFIRSKSAADSVRSSETIEQVVSRRNANRVSP